MSCTAVSSRCICTGTLLTLLCCCLVTLQFLGRCGAAPQAATNAWRLPQILALITDMALVPAETGVAPEAVAEAYHAFEQGSQVAPLTAAAVSNQTIQESMRLLLLVRAYQVGCTC